MANVARSNYVGARTSGATTRATNPFNGSFEENSSVQFADYVDGTSNTIIVGERSSEFGSVKPTAAVIWGTCGLNQANVDRVFHVVFVGKGMVNSTDESLSTNNNSCRMGLASLHPGGAQVALADGSVRFLNDTIDQKPDVDRQVTVIDSVYERLISRNDKTPVGNY